MSSCMSATDSADKESLIYQTFSSHVLQTPQSNIDCLALFCKWYIFVVSEHKAKALPLVPLKSVCVCVCVCSTSLSPPRHRQSPSVPDAGAVFPAPHPAPSSFLPIKWPSGSRPTHRE